MASIGGDTHVRAGMRRRPDLGGSRLHPLYTTRLGVLDQQLLKSPFSLSEARVLYELANRENPSAKAIGTELGLDAGYLSRIVQKFEEDGLIRRKASPSDRRQHR